MSYDAAYLEWSKVQLDAYDTDEATKSTDGVRRVDLDKIEATLRGAKTAPDAWAMRYYHDGIALVAELRAAREVVAAADLYWTTFGDEAGGAIPDRLAHALNAYDEAVGS